MANELLQNTLIPGVVNNTINAGTAEKTTPTEGGISVSPTNYTIPKTYANEPLKATTTFQPTIISADQARTDVAKKDQEISQVSQSIQDKQKSDAEIRAGQLSKLNEAEKQLKDLQAQLDKQKERDSTIQAITDAVKEEPETITPTETAPVKTDEQTQLENIYADQDKAYQDYKSSISKIENGEIPLTTEEQAQLNEINRTFDELRSSQMEANKNYESAITIAGIAAGRQRYAPEIEAGNIKEAVDSGIKKVQSIDSKRLSSIAEFKQAIKDKKYKQANDAYNAFRQYSQDKAGAIKDIYTIAKNEQDRVDKIAKEALDYKLELEKEQNKLDLENKKQINEIAKEIAKNDPSKNINDILNAKSVAEAISLAGDSLQTATGVPGEYLFYKRQSIANGKNFVDYEQFEKIKRQQELNLVAAKAAIAESFKSREEKPPTQAQYTNAGYATRIEQSDDTLKNLESIISDMSPAKFFIEKKSPNWVQSDTFQVYEQASRNFINAVLRRESGAAIAPSEFESAEKQYLPIAGDSQNVLKEKEINRKAVLNNLKKASGNAYESIGDLLKQSTADIADKQAQIDPLGIGVEDKSINDPLGIR